LRRHRPLILNWFRDLGMSSAGVVEGFNGKAKLTTRKAYGFRTSQGIEFALLFHVMGHTYPSRNPPTNSAEEARFRGGRSVPQFSFHNSSID